MSLILTERHEPEPVEFARLIQHLERGEITACRADACQQGRSKCPCPEACMKSVSEDDASEAAYGFDGTGPLVVGFVMAVIGAVGLIVWTVFA